MHQYFHTVFGFCLWDVLALGVLAAIVAVLAVHVAARRRQNKLEQELENRRKEQSAQEDRQEPESG